MATQAGIVFTLGHIKIHVTDAVRARHHFGRYIYDFGAPSVNKATRCHAAPPAATEDDEDEWNSIGKIQPFPV